MCAHSVTLKSFMDRDEEKGASNEQPRVVTPEGCLVFIVLIVRLSIGFSQAEECDWLKLPTSNL
jgi:hypothetical protein